MNRERDKKIAVMLRRMARFKLLSEKKLPSSLLDAEASLILQGVAELSASEIVSMSEQFAEYLKRGDLC